MSAIPTATGDLEVGSLGRTLMHEHLFISSVEIERDYADMVGWDEETEVARAIDMLKRAKDGGIDSLVDLTVLGHGRNVERVQRVAEAVDVNIVVATGLYALAELPRLFAFIGPGAWVDRPELLTEMFIRDLTVGIGSTGVRAGVIKVATDEAGVTPGVDRVLRAAATAQRETGAPISTHAHASLRRGLEQQRIFRDEGVDLTRVVIGHCGDSTDLDYLKRIADAGSYLGMDRFGMDGGRYPTADERADTVARLAEAGYAERMVLSHDTASWRGWLPPTLVAGTLADFGHLDFGHIPTRVVPALRERGVTQVQLDQMLIGNPAEILGGGAA